MMISPESFAAMHRNKSYKELLPVRDELLEEIRAFEEHADEPKLYYIAPSPEVVYQCNLLYLGKMLELIAERYNEEVVWGEEDN